MDTPRPEQIRTMQPDAQEPTDEDSLELMEMILGALGKDAVGLGARSKKHFIKCTQTKKEQHQKPYKRSGPHRISNIAIIPYKHPCTHYSTGHPRESEEWKSMTMEQRYAFFAPVWRVMRNENVTVEQVAEQVRYVALTVKQGSQVSTPYTQCCGKSNERDSGEFI
eukprot:scaffold120825_cov18-Tisochrysis_lutea.AAC.3